MGYEDYLAQKQKEADGLVGGRGSAVHNAGTSGGTGVNSRVPAGQTVDGSGRAQTGQTDGKAGKAAPTLTDVFDKKTYYNPGKIRSRLKNQLEKYERQLSESEERLAELQMQLADPALASDYSKLMELQEAIDAEEKNQESLLERMLETETELEEMEE